MEILSDLTTPLFATILTLIVSIILYRAEKKAEIKHLRYRLGVMLHVEIANIAKALTGNDIVISSKTLRGPTIIPRSVYDGLVSSGNVSIFDVDLQEKLYDWYDYERLYQHNNMLNGIEKISNLIDKSNKNNKTFLRYF